MKRTRRAAAGIRAWALMLALALLVPAMQVAGWAHGLSHAAASAGERAPPGADHCDACVGFTALAAALHVATPRFACVPLVHAAPARCVAPAGPACACRPYLARAPPPFAA